MPAQYHDANDEINCAQRSYWLFSEADLPIHIWKAISTGQYEQSMFIFNFTAMTSDLPI